MNDRSLSSRLPLAAFVLDLGARDLRTANDRPVELRRKALEVLLMLGEQAGHVVDKDTLMARVWPGVVVGDDSLTQAVVEIRRVLGDADRRLLRTVARRGYLLQPSGVETAVLLSIAVLPIVCRDPDGEGRAEALTAELSSRVGVGLFGSRVVAREAAAALGGNDPRAVASALGVHQVVCGELHATAKGWRLALAMVDGASGERRWSRGFELAREANAGRLDDIAAQAARALLVEMHRSAAQRAAARPQSERSADELAIQGWAAVYDGASPANFERALRFFELAVAADARNLRGLGGISCCNKWLDEMGWAKDSAEALRRAHDAAALLEQLYPQDILTWRCRASVAGADGRWELKLSICDRMCERDAGDPTAHFQRGQSLLHLGRFDEAIASIERAFDCSVDDFRAGHWHEILACAELMSGRPQRAIERARLAMAANPCLLLPPLLLATALAEAGQAGAGREILGAQRAREGGGNLTQAARLFGGGSPAYERGRDAVLAVLGELGFA